VLVVAHAQHIIFSIFSLRCDSVTVAPRADGGTYTAHHFLNILSTL